MFGESVTLNGRVSLTKIGSVEAVETVALNSPISVPFMASPSISLYTDDIVVVVSSEVSFPVVASVDSVAVSATVAGANENTMTDGTVTEDIVVSSVLFSEETDGASVVSFVGTLVTAVSFDGMGTVVNAPTSVVRGPPVIMPEVVVSSNVTAVVACSVVCNVVPASVTILAVALVTSLLSVAKAATVDCLISRVIKLSTSVANCGSVVKVVLVVCSVACAVAGLVVVTVPSVVGSVVALVVAISVELGSGTGSAVVVGEAVVASRINVPGGISIFDVVVSCPGVVGDSVTDAGVVVMASIGACVVVVRGKGSAVIRVVVSDSVVS